MQGRSECVRVVCCVWPCGVHMWREVSLAVRVPACCVVDVRLGCWVEVLGEVGAAGRHCARCAARGGPGDGTLRSCARGGFLGPGAALCAWVCAERDDDECGAEGR